MLIHCSAPSGGPGSIGFLHIYIPIFLHNYIYFYLLKITVICLATEYTKWVSGVASLNTLACWIFSLSKMGISSPIRCLSSHVTDIIRLDVPVSGSCVALEGQFALSPHCPSLPIHHPPIGLLLLHPREIRHPNIPHKEDKHSDFFALLKGHGFLLYRTKSDEPQTLWISYPCWIIFFTCPPQVLLLEINLWAITRNDKIGCARFCEMDRHSFFKGRNNYITSIV